MSPIPNAQRTFSLAELAERLDGAVIGDATIPISGVANVQDAQAGHLVRVDDARYLSQAMEGPGAALLLGPGVNGIAKPAVQVANPRLAFAQALELFHPRAPVQPGIHPTAVLDPTAQIGADCTIMAYAVVGRNVRLGRGVVIYPHCTLGDDVEVGDDTAIFPHVTLYHGTVLGARVRVHAGAVIGADGFGYVWDGQRHLRVPQVGHVRVLDDVEIGALCAVDRGTTGATVLGEGTKTDNLVQIGHNVKTGAHCLIIAQAGLGGTVTLGQGTVIAGQAGLRDHVVVGEGGRVAGGAEVWHDVPPNVTVSGAPAVLHREAMRTHLSLRQLPDALRTLRRLEQRVRELEARLAAAEPPQFDAET